MSDKFEKFYTNPEDPANYAFSITPDSDTDLTNSTRAIYVGTAGNLVVSMVSETSNTFVTFSSVPAGSILPIRVRRVSSTSSASNLVGLY